MTGVSQSPCQIRARRGIDSSGRTVSAWKFAVSPYELRRLKGVRIGTTASSNVAIRTDRARPACPTNGRELVMQCVWRQLQSVCHSCEIGQ
jgi:hypothetical protein